MMDEKEKKELEQLRETVKQQEKVIEALQIRRQELLYLYEESQLMIADMKRAGAASGSGLAGKMKRLFRKFI